MFTTGGRSTSYNISNLLPYQQISIEMTASTRIGEGPSSVHETRTAQARTLDSYYGCQSNSYVCLFVCSAPQEVTQIMVDVVSDNNIQVQWGPPARANGILTHYTVTVINQETGFDFSTRVNASAAEVVAVPGLSTLKYSPSLQLTPIHPHTQAHPHTYAQPHRVH